MPKNQRVPELFFLDVLPSSRTVPLSICEYSNVRECSNVRNEDCNKQIESLGASNPLFPELTISQSLIGDSMLNQPELALDDSTLLNPDTTSFADVMSGISLADYSEAEDGEFLSSYSHLHSAENSVFSYQFEMNEKELSKDENQIKICEEEIQTATLFETRNSTLFKTETKLVFTDDSDYTQNLPLYSNSDQVKKLIANDNLTSLPTKKTTATTTNKKTKKQTASTRKQPRRKRKSIEYYNESSESDSEKCALAKRTRAACSNAPKRFDDADKYYKKKTPRSKSGCWTCRLRRKKCPEERPGCSQCQRLGLHCDGYAVERPIFMTKKMEQNKRLNEIKQHTGKARRLRIVNMHQMRKAKRSNLVSLG